MNEHGRADRAVTDGGLRDRHEQRHEAVGGVEEPADVEAAVVGVLEAARRRGRLFFICGTQRRCAHEDRDATHDANKAALPCIRATANRL